MQQQLTFSDVFAVCQQLHSTVEFHRAKARYFVNAFNRAANTTDPFAEPSAVQCFYQAMFNNHTFELMKAEQACAKYDAVCADALIYYQTPPNRG